MNNLNNIFFLETHFDQFQRKLTTHIQLTKTKAYTDDELLSEDRIERIDGDTYHSRKFIVDVYNHEDTLPTRRKMILLRLKIANLEAQYAALENTPENDQEKIVICRKLAANYTKLHNQITNTTETHRAYISRISNYSKIAAKLQRKADPIQKIKHILMDVIRKKKIPDDPDELIGELEQTIAQLKEELKSQHRSNEITKTHKSIAHAYKTLAFIYDKKSDELANELFAKLTEKAKSGNYTGSYTDGSLQQQRDNYARYQSLAEKTHNAIPKHLNKAAKETTRVTEKAYRKASKEGREILAAINSTMTIKHKRRFFWRRKHEVVDVDYSKLMDVCGDIFNNKVAELKQKATGNLDEATAFIESLHNIFFVMPTDKLISLYNRLHSPKLEKLITDTTLVASRFGDLPAEYRASLERFDEKIIMPAVFSTTAPIRLFMDALGSYLQNNAHTNQEFEGLSAVPSESVNTENLQLILPKAEVIAESLEQRLNKSKLPKLVA